MDHHFRLRGALGAAAAMSCVGTLTAVSAVIKDYPVFGGQAVRYAAAAALLFGAMRLSSARPGERAGFRLRDLGSGDMILLAALAATGLAAFNVCIVEAARDTSPATIGTVIATVPIALAVAGPLLEGRRPTARVVAAACVVAFGAGLACGLGDTGPRGLLLSLGALAGEMCFSLLAVPLLPKLGPVRLSACSAALAAPMLGVVGLVLDGRDFIRTPTVQEAAGLAYLGGAVTTVAFCLWYDALGRLGADHAGLFAGLVPVSAVVTTMVLGLGRPSGTDLAGAVLVGGGVVLGMRARHARAAPAHPRDGRMAAGS